MPQPVELRAVETLCIPLGNRLDASVHVLPVATAVRAGEPVVRMPVEVGGVPIAPVAGKLGAVVSVGSLRQPAVELIPDEPTEPVAGDPWSGAGLGRLLDLLRDAGVQANRHGSPDFISQLEQALRHPVDIVLCNALDPDPPLRVNAVALAHHAVEIAEAARVLSDQCGAGRCAIVYDQSSPAPWVNAIRREARTRRIETIGIVNDYPQYDPSLLLAHALGRRLRPGRLPIEQGVLLADALLMSDAGAAILHGRHVCTTLAGIFDHPHQEIHYARAPIGMKWADLLGQLRIWARDVDLHAGAILRDLNRTADDVVDSGEVVLHLSGAGEAVAPLPCIRCSWCSQGCPVRIEPAGLLEAAQQKDHALAERYGLESCIECGICSYVCPSRLPLLTGLRTLLRDGRGAR
jgi:electron transport complex protein RnfC